MNQYVLKTGTTVLTAPTQDSIIVVADRQGTLGYKAMDVQKIKNYNFVEFKTKRIVEIGIALAGTSNGYLLYEEALFNCFRRNVEVSNNNSYVDAESFFNNFRKQVLRLAQGNLPDVILIVVYKNAQELTYRLVCGDGYSITPADNEALCIGSGGDLAIGPYVSEQLVKKELLDSAKVKDLLIKGVTAATTIDAYSGKNKKLTVVEMFKDLNKKTKIELLDI